MIRIDRARLEDTFREQARIGATPANGLTRLALSDEDKLIRDRMVGWLETAGCAVRIDRMGNIVLSGAGHDAQHMAALCSTGMVFVPSIGGKSHCEEEATDFDDIEHGANTLLHAALELAGEP